MDKKLLDYTEARVRVGEADVTVRREGTFRVRHCTSSRPRSSGGRSARLWLDRLIHKPGETRIGGIDCPVYEVTGAFVSVLYEHSTHS